MKSVTSFMEIVFAQMDTMESNANLVSTIVKKKLSKLQRKRESECLVGMTYHNGFGIKWLSSYLSALRTLESSRFLNTALF